jgi:tRNA pseudouridine32 synthase/23S rRNA pseudouridine746 synthase
MDAPLLLETPDAIAVAKPPGVVVIPARGEDPGASLWHALERARGERLWVVHRLDRDTSGVLLFARNAAAHRALSMAFESGGVHKTYLALTDGMPSPDEGVIDAPLHPARRGRMRPAAPGEAGSLPSATAYRVLRRWVTPDGPVAFVEVSPRTGRQHQVRVHLRFAGAPLLGDRIYGRAAGIAAPRLALHALRVEVPGLGISVEAELAADLAALVAALDGRTS